MGDGSREEPSTTGSSRWWPAGVAALALVAAALGAATLTAGLPYPGYIDEHYVTEAAAHQLAEGTWDPGWYWYPSLLISLTTVAAWVGAVVTGSDLQGPAELTVASPYVGIQEPVHLLVGGRVVVLAAAVATVVVTALLGRRIAGPRVGLVAAAFVAVLPAFVRRSSIVVTDVPAALGTTACLWATTRLAAARSVIGPAALAGAAAGVATTSKYTAGAVVLVPLVVAAVRPDRLRGVAAVVGGWALTSVATMPALVVRPGAVIDDVRAQSWAYANHFSTTTPYLRALTGGKEVGVLIVVLAAAGMVVLARQARHRPFLAGTVAWAVASAVVLLRVGYQPVRNLLPFVPWLCVAAAVAIDAAARWVVARTRFRDRPATGAALTWAIVAGLALVAAVVPAIVSAKYVVRGERVEPRVDSRVQAVDWLRDRVGPGDRVLVSTELMILPSELDRLGAEVEVAPHTTPAGLADHDYLVVGRIAEAPGHWPVARDGREVVFRRGRLYASCGPEARPVDDDLCPASAAPRAFPHNDVLVEVYGPRADAEGG